MAKQPAKILGTSETANIKTRESFDLLQRALKTFNQTSKVRRATGRSLTDFKTQETEGKLLPAEDELLTSYRTNQYCILPNEIHSLFSDYDELVDDPLLYEIAQNYRETKLKDPNSVFSHKKDANPIIAEVINKITEAALEDISKEANWKPITRAEKKDFERTFRNAERELRGWRAIDPSDKSIHVRAEFIRFLMLGGDDSTGMGTQGVQLSGAHILGDINVSSCTVEHPTLLSDSLVSGQLILRDANARTLSLTGSKIKGIAADRATINGGLILRNGFSSWDTIDLSGARIQDDLDCADANLITKIGDCLNLAGAIVTGSVILSGDIEAIGCIDLSGARIGCDLNMRDATCLSNSFYSIMADSAWIDGSVIISGDFNSYGMVTFSGAHISNDFTVTGGDFTPNETNNTDELKADALSLARATIGGTLFLRPIFSDGFEWGDINGPLDLQICTCKNFIFNAMILNDNTTTYLDGFSYKHIIVEGSDALSAMNGLLAKQTEYSPQPYEQLSRTLKSMGREDDGKAITRKKTAARRRSQINEIWTDLLSALTNRPQAAEWLGKLNWVAYPMTSIVAIARAACSITANVFVMLVYEIFLGSGFSKAPIIALYIAMLIGCGWVYEKGAEKGMFVPTDHGFISLPQVRKACAPDQDATDLSKAIDWYNCPGKVRDLNPFRPYVYSFDLMLQIGPLGQRRDWKPEANSFAMSIPYYGKIEMPARGLETLIAFQISISLILYAMLIAMATGMIKKD